MNVIAFCKYGRMGASSRLRTMQYVAPMAAQGISLKVHSLLEDEYLSSLYSGRTYLFPLMAAYFKRARQLIESESCDLIHVEKEFFPWLPYFSEKAFLPRGVPISIDLDDAIFHNYDRHRNPFVRRLLGHKIDRLMAMADLVTTGSKYIQDRAFAAGAIHVEYIPTVVDVDRYSTKKSTRGGPIVIGWVGSPSTSKYLRRVVDPLIQLSSKYDIKCVAVGANPADLEGTPFCYAPWAEGQEASLVSGFDIGLMPLNDSAWEMGKCAYKIIQYMASGVPFVASPVGMNIEILARSPCGKLADTEHDWYVELEKLVIDSELRTALGGRGRMEVERFFCVRAQAPILARLWRGVAERP